LSGLSHAHALNLSPRRQVTRNDDALDRGNVDSAPIVLHDKMDSLSAPAHAQFDSAVGRFARGDAFGFGLDAMSDGVPDDVNQGVSQSQQDMRVQTVFAAGRDEHHVPAERLRGIPHCPLQMTENDLRRQKSKFSQAVARVSQIPLSAFQSVAQNAAVLPHRLA
jgi:hypothetical protein